ncbi:MAG: PEP-CTERM sorting domain-containing protein [Bryobacteraceae bacterium]|nr:PEP-CTERM sorting domain-containing protein [Bryobacteraceae bacterium]
MKKRIGGPVGLTIGLLAAMSLQGATLYYGADNGVGPGDARPLSDAARSAFVAATGAGGPITFEGLAVGFNSNFTAAPGVDVTMTNLEANACGGVCATDEHSPIPLGYNVTAGGRQHLRVVPPFGDQTGGSVTFSFAVPIYAFGFYLTDTQENFPGPITVSFDDGGSISLGITKNDETGGALFWGYSNPGAAITSFSISTGATGDSRDLWGVDDVYYSQIPEPGTIFLLGAGLAFVGWKRRR